MANFLELYPWQIKAWEHVVDSLGRLPHAILFAGTEGIGKLRFATRLAVALLCESEEKSPCGECRNCRLFSSGTHPDLHVLTSEARLESMDSVLVSYADRYLDDQSSRAKRKIPRSTIVIDQIRALIENANVKPHLSVNKVFVIDPVDSMTNAGANSLLKVLEEPAPNTFLVLIAQSTQNLLPTISSRCQKLFLPAPDSEQIEKWLVQQKLRPQEIRAIQQSGKGPVVALQQLQNDEILRSTTFGSTVLKQLQRHRQRDLFELIELGNKLGEAECLDELLQLVSKLIREVAVAKERKEKEETLLSEIALRADQRKLFLIYDHIGLLRNQIRAGGLDKTLAVEDALIAIDSCVR